MSSAAARCRPAPPRVAPDRRLYAIGDIHGRADLLDRLLRRIAADAARFRDGRRPGLVLLGDYVDRGDDPRAVLERVMRLHRAGAVCLMGNHEAALLAFLDDPRRGAAWLAMGGAQTLAAYGVALPDGRDPAALTAAARALGTRLGPHLTFLREGLARTHRSGRVVFAHAALSPGIALAAQGDAVLWGDPAFLARGWKAGVLVVHGHYDAPAPSAGPGRLCIDTGAYYTNRLTSLRLDCNRTILQSEVE